MPCVQRFQDFIPQLCLSKVLQNELGKILLPLNTQFLFKSKNIYASFIS